MQGQAHTSSMDDRAIPLFRSFNARAVNTPDEAMVEIAYMTARGEIDKGLAAYMNRCVHFARKLQETMIPVPSFHGLEGSRDPIAVVQQLALTLLPRSQSRPH